VLESPTRSIEYRKARQEFIARGLASATQAKKTGNASADKVIDKLARKLTKAKRRAA
jgi:ribosome-associated translation inhibitor RaiA